MAQFLYALILLRFNHRYTLQTFIISHELNEYPSDLFLNIHLAFSVSVAPVSISNEE